jgi:Protein of unknown function (DUF3383)
MSLPVSNLVQVNVNLSPLPAQTRTFGRLLILGDSSVISGLERKRDYSNNDGVAADFGVNAPEAKAAALFFSQSPKPAQLSIGRWLRQDTAAMAQGAILSASQSALVLFTSITSGGFDVTIDTVVKHLLGMDFSAQTNLNGVASVITTALSGAGTCVWNGSQFVITSATAGVGVAANGSITVSANPTALDTITVNGITVTFVGSAPTGNQVLIGGTAAQTAVNLHTFLQASTSPNIRAATYSVAGAVISIVYNSVGVAGDAYTLVTSNAVAITLSGATLVHGAEASSVGYASSPASGQDVSGLLGLTSALGLPLVPGYAAESPLEAVAALSAISTQWYGCMFAASVMPTDDQNMAICPFIEADGATRTFGVTIQNSNALSAVVTNDLASRMKAGGFEQSFCQYSSASPYAVASFFGRAFSVNFAGTDTTICLMFKQEPGITPEELTQTQANALQAKRCNVFVEYDNDTAILQYGTMSGPAFFDEIQGLDWLQNAVQTACYNLLYANTTKVPQTDSGVNQFVVAIAGIFDQGVANGLMAPGVWSAPGFGQLSQGQYLKTGYYIYAPPVSSQSESDRAARVSPPIQCAVKLAGAIQQVLININVNR